MKCDWCGKEIYGQYYSIPDWFHTLERNSLCSKACVHAWKQAGIDEYVTRGFGNPAIIKDSLALMEENTKLRTVEDDEAAEAEVQRFEHACTAAAEQLSKLAEEMKAKIGEEHAMLFEVHAMLAEDSDFQDAVRTLIREQNINAEYATQEGSVTLSREYAAMGDVYMTARATDILDVAKRIIGILSGT